MWFRKRKFTSRAVAYLKGAVPPDEPGGVIELSGDDSPVLRDLNNGLLVAYVVDIGSTFQWVQFRDLKKDAIDEQQLHALGIANLERLAATQTRVAPYPNGSMYAVFLDGNFEASLILLDHLWEGSFRQFVSGQYAVAIPARDILAFCDASSPEGLHELREVLRRLNEAGMDHPISNHW